MRNNYRCVFSKQHTSSGGSRCARFGNINDCFVHETGQRQWHMRWCRTISYDHISKIGIRSENVTETHLKKKCQANIKLLTQVAYYMHTLINGDSSCELKSI